MGDMNHGQLVSRVATKNRSGNARDGVHVHGRVGEESGHGLNWWLGNEPIAEPANTRRSVY